MPDKLSIQAYIQKVSCHLDLSTAHPGRPLSAEDRYQDAHAVMAKNRDGQMCLVAKANVDPTLPWREEVGKLIALWLRDGGDIIEQLDKAQRAADAGHEWNRVQRDQITKLQRDLDLARSKNLRLEGAATRNREALDEARQHVAERSAEANALAQKLKAIHDVAIAGGPDLGEVLTQIRAMAEPDSDVGVTTGARKCGQCGHLNCSHAVEVLPPVPFDDEYDPLDDADGPVYGDGYDDDSYSTLPPRPPITAETVAALRKPGPFKAPDAVNQPSDVLAAQHNAVYGDEAVAPRYVLRQLLAAMEDVDFGARPQEFWDAKARAQESLNPATGVVPATALKGLMAAMDEVPDWGPNSEAFWRALREAQVMAAILAGGPTNQLVSLVTILCGAEVALQGVDGFQDADYAERGRSVLQAIEDFIAKLSRPTKES